MRYCTASRQRISAPNDNTQTLTKATAVFSSANFVTFWTLILTIKKHTGRPRFRLSKNTCTLIYFPEVRWKKSTPNVLYRRNLHYFV